MQPAPCAGMHRVGYMTRLGADPLSRAVRVELDREGIACSATETDPTRTLGIYSVSTDDSGERSFHYWRDRSAARLLFDTEGDLAVLDNASLIYLSGITLAIMGSDARTRLMDRLSVLVKSGVASVAYDSNYRPALWESRDIAKSVNRRMWTIADIALPSLDDEMALFAESADAVMARFASRSWRRCAVKRGALGPTTPHFACDLPQFTPASRIVDTTAAGDSFNGAYLAALIEGRNEAACLTAGHELARAVVQHPGAIRPKI